MYLNSAYQVTKKISNIGISSYVTNHESEDDSYVILCIKLLEFIPVQFVYSWIWVIQFQKSILIFHMIL